MCAGHSSRDSFLPPSQRTRKKNKKRKKETTPIGHYNEGGWTSGFEHRAKNVEESFPQLKVPTKSPRLMIEASSQTAQHNLPKGLALHETTSVSLPLMFTITSFVLSLYSYICLMYCSCSSRCNTWWRERLLNILKA